MKNKTYRYGKLQFRAYIKPVGQGYEAGLVFEGKSLFVGNFVHSAEANKWWGRMNLELRNFISRFKAADTVSKVWYCKFITAHINKCYYAFIEKQIVLHERKAERQFNSHARQYKGLKRNWPTNVYPRLKVG
jgi:hypothetical protein